MMMLKSVMWWRKPEYPEETTDLRQVTDETFHTYGLCPVRGLNLGRSGVKQPKRKWCISNVTPSCVSLGEGGCFKPESGRKVWFKKLGW